MAFRPTIVRSDKSSRAFARGTNAVGICHRSGFKYPLKELKFEPGTNHFVHKSENDGLYSEVAHPQNYPPEDRVERIGLRWVFEDTPLSLGTVVSAEQLFLPAYACVCNQWIITPSVTWISAGAGVSISVGSGVSGFSLDFSQPQNSQYLIIVFPGI